MYPSVTRILSCFAFFGFIFTSHSYAQGEAAINWDIQIPRGETREIDFMTEEGTWMSVDVSPDGSWIVFDLLGHIYRIDSNGGEAISLTQSSGIAMNVHPSISPNGQEIAFVSDRGGQENLWVMDADGSNPRLIHEDMKARAAEPAWTPDGQFIVITRRNESATGFYRTVDDLWKFPREGGEGEVLINFSVSSGGAAPARTGVWTGFDRAQWASFTPDGKTVYFNSSAFRGSERKLRRMDIETGHIDDVTENKGRYQSCCGHPAYPTRLGEASPEVSPDGKWLAFARKLPGGRTSYRGKELMSRTALWLRNLETGDERIIMDPITQSTLEHHPSWNTRTLPGYSWTNDGKYIIISQGGKIRRLTVQSGKVETIPFKAHVKRTISEQARGNVTIDDNMFTARALRWPVSSPDGSKLVFEAVGQLWIMDLPNGKPVPLIKGGNDDFTITPSWSPDGKWITYVTTNEETGGHVWKINAKGGTAIQLTKTAGIYLNPHWINGGKSILVSHWDDVLTLVVNSDQWQWLTLSAEDGKIEETSLTSLPYDHTVGDDGRIFYRSGGKLKSAKPNGEDVQTLAGLPPRAVDVVPSPDGKWLAIAEGADVFLAPMPENIGGDKPVTIDTVATGKRLSVEGGAFPHWRDNETLEFIGPKKYFTHNLKTGETKRVDITLQVAKDIALGTIALTNARIITMEDRKVIKRGSVLVKDGRITCVGKCDTSTASKKINLKGKTIMPGWVDLHAHQLTPDKQSGITDKHLADPARYLAYGVTTAHDPSIQAPTLSHGYAMNELINAGKIIGPRSYASPPLTCGTYGTFREITSFEEAQHKVNWLGDFGTISIKDYKQCTRTQRAWLAEATRQRGLTLTSEGSDMDYFLGLIMTGHAGWEHPIQYLPIYSDISRFFGQSGAHYSAQLLISDYPEGSALEYWYGESDLFQDEKLMYWSPWKETAARRSFVKKPKREFSFPILAEGAADIKRAGGYVAVGAHGEQDGLGTHWEVWAMAEGMTPMEAIEAATMDSVHFLGLENELGSISVGKIADIVVMNSNPLDNIRNTADIAYVMKAGRLYIADTLDEIWPRQKPYGYRPWANKDAMRDDLRPDDYWDKK